ncbi:capsid protein [Clostridium sp. D2Q-14]|uniref:capsid protein n=1 Tax=Anaeromonas gelatinilytica TaxID=2683194 RepID=UPI00193C4672|nr:capsid protein [Anaeromonas gelatinilytica]MBS4534988.1 capsid protein [Anaeromonas gelatinilytica]
MGLKEVIKNMVMKALNIVPATDNTISIREPLSHNMNVLRNRIWYRGDPSELDQFFKQIATDDVGKSRFWAAVPSTDSSIRKFHSGIPGEIVDKLADIVIADLDNIELLEQDLWDEIALDNKFSDELLADAIKDTLIEGDGAFKLSVDEEISKYPIIEFYSGSDVDYTYKRGRLQEIKFYAYYTHNKETYRLDEIYGKGSIDYKLYDKNNKEVPLSKIPEISHLSKVIFAGDFLMAVPMKFFKSAKFKNRGNSLFERKSDNFDALDEVISQWIDAIRAGRVKNYIPEDLVPKNPDTGAAMRPNPFDNQFIKIGSSMKEDAKDQIDQIQADINYTAFVESYASTLDMCLQGVISPSTLGIDLKKTDNAEAQREKEKTTLYTRGKIIDVLTEVIPLLINTTLKVHDNMELKFPGDYEASITFGEYASPDFGSVAEVVGQAKNMGIMSLEQAIEELYGDTWTDKEKALEVKRIREGDKVIDEPSTWVDRFKKGKQENPEDGEDVIEDGEE